jgi:hypothetical protein
MGTRPQSPVVEALVILMLAGLSIAAINRAVAWVYLDNPATIRAAARSVLPRLRTYLWLMTITAFRAWAPFAALYVAFIGIAFTVLPHDFMTNPTAMQHAAHQDPTAVAGCGHRHADSACRFLLWLSCMACGCRCAIRSPCPLASSKICRRPQSSAASLSEGSRGRIFVLGLAGLRGAHAAGDSVRISLDRARHQASRPAAASGLVDRLNRSASFLIQH